MRASRKFDHAALAFHKSTVRDDQHFFEPPPHPATLEMRVRLTGPKNASHLIEIRDAFSVVAAPDPNAMLSVVMRDCEVDCRGIRVQRVLEQFLDQQGRLAASENLQCLGAARNQQLFFVAYIEARYS